MKRPELVSRERLRRMRAENFAKNSNQLPSAISACLACLAVTSRLIVERQPVRF
jgi:hypothetical protein